MATSSPGSSYLGVTDNQKRWLVVGIALNKILVPQIRPFVEQEVEKEYNIQKTSNNIHTQSYSGGLPKWLKDLKFENINNNDSLLKLGGKRWNYPKFDYKVSTHIDFAKLYVANFMAKFNAFDDHCDASAVLTLLGSVPVFSSVVQTSAGVVRVVRNDWAHCMFSKWDVAKFQQGFADMADLVRKLGLPAKDETKLLGELNDWETNGTHLCMNSPVDQHLLQLVQQHVKLLENAVQKMSEESEDGRREILDELQKCWFALEDTKNKLNRFEERVGTVEETVCDLKESFHVTNRRVENLEDGLREFGEELLKQPGKAILLGQPNLPLNDNNFIGREEEIKEIASLLKSQSTRIVGVFGPPGSGKSEVAIAVGHYLKHQGKAIYHIDLTDVNTEDGLISAILRYFSDHPTGILQPIDFLLKQFSLIKDSVSPYFILDNANSLLQTNELKDRFLNLINQILISCASAKLLVVTRKSIYCRKLKTLGLKLVRIGSVDNVYSQKLVQDYFPEGRDTDWSKVARFCEDRPFA